MIHMESKRESCGSNLAQMLQGIIAATLMDDPVSTAVKLEECLDGQISRNSWQYAVMKLDRDLFNHHARFHDCLQDSILSTFNVDFQQIDVPVAKFSHQAGDGFAFHRNHFRIRDLVTSLGCF